MAADHELDGFEELAELLAAGPSDVVDETPTPDLWARIEAAVDAEVAASEHDGGSVLGAEADVVAIEEVRRSRWAPVTATIVGIAAALLLIGLPLGLALRSSSSEPDSFATLDPLGAFEGDGWAEIDGRELTVGVDGLRPTDDAFYELWLLDLDDGELRDLVSLGHIDHEGTWTVPDDVDLERFTVVDISVEPDDGDPAHSGDSVLQGELT